MSIKVKDGDIAFNEIKDLKFDFSLQEKLDGKSNMIINSTTIPFLYKEFLDISLKNIYITSSDIKDQKMSSLPFNSEKYKNEFLKIMEKNMIESVVYNCFKFGTLKYGPILFFMDLDEGKKLLVDLSFYTFEGRKNILPSIFSEKISNLLELGMKSNFLNFVLSKNLRPSIETLKILFPRSFVLMEGSKRVDTRRDLQSLFDYLLGLTNNIVPDFKILKFDSV
jgi:hypothetical protein